MFNLECPENKYFRYFIQTFLTFFILSFRLLVYLHFYGKLDECVRNEGNND